MHIVTGPISYGIPLLTRSCLGRPAGAAVWCTEAPVVTVEVDPARVESRLAAGGDLVPPLRCWGFGQMWSCPCSMDRRVGGFASSSAGTVPQLSEDARIAAGDGVVA